MTYGEKIIKVTKIIKARFPNLSTDETVQLSVELVNAVTGVE